MFFQVNLCEGAARDELRLHNLTDCGGVAET